MVLAGVWKGTFTVNYIQILSHLKSCEMELKPAGAAGGGATAPPPVLAKSFFVKKEEGQGEGGSGGGGGGGEEAAKAKSPIAMVSGPQASEPARRLLAAPASWLGASVRRFAARLLAILGSAVGVVCADGFGRGTSWGRFRRRRGAPDASR